MVERQARDLEVRGSNPGPGSNLCLEFEKNQLRQKSFTDCNVLPKISFLVLQ